MNVLVAFIVGLSTLIVPAPPVRSADLCSPRPPIKVAISQFKNNDIVSISVTPTRNEHIPQNRISAVRYTRFTNVDRIATPDVPLRSAEPFVWTDVGRGSSGGEVIFIVSRGGPGTMQVELVAVDACGDWPSFVGIPAQVTSSTVRVPSRVPTADLPPHGRHP